MKAVTVTKLKKELELYAPKELVEVCLKLAKFKKENKELLTYLLFESMDEWEYIQQIKAEIDQGFSELNQESLYYLKRGIRKQLRILKKYIRYSKNKQTETELLIHFCSKFKELRPKQQRSLQIVKIRDTQLDAAKKAISYLHEDLQYDYKAELENLE